MTEFTTANDYDPEESSKPEFKNTEGVAAWINKTKNGDAYIRIDLPFGLGGLSLFPANEKLKKVFNQVYAEINS